ncbi:helix-turn-helix domain-containing protein [Actinomadura graeca]|uniref:Helix-turn-helix domain-containing protein n=1 Tax=Actinomadura graeca TaxID=2750812 RepID=A0ABX8R476_9ACTN|nr:helix-turn-helix transcriptional regulator [Actinomadura graeca]QXJ25885.1 helix-turn-helix domain-containing protein [Actinomadura graeca]
MVRVLSERSAESGRAAEHSPALSRRRLSTLLRLLREGSGLTATEVARRLGVQTSTVTRGERGEWSRPDPEYVGRLLDALGVTDRQLHRMLLQLAWEGRERGWWNSYRAITETYKKYLGLEEGASRICVCDPQMVPHLLQTEEYSRAALVGRYPQLRGDACAGEGALVEQHLRVLHQRKRLITRPDPVHLWAVIGQQALRPPDGDAEGVLARQLEHLHVMAQRPNVDIQVIPWSAGVPPTPNPFTVLRFRHPLDPEAGWMETVLGSRMVDDPTDVAHLHEIWVLMVDLALTRRQSCDLLSRPPAE